MVNKTPASYLGYEIYISLVSSDDTVGNLLAVELYNAEIKFIIHKNFLFPIDNKNFMF